MKKVIFILTCIFLINSINCFSQSVEKNKKEFKSKTRYVYGYKNGLNGELYLGITFGKDISSVDTTYYIKFHLHAPTLEYPSDICLNRANAITFLAKSGRFVDLKLTDVNASTKSDKQTQDPFAPIMMHYHSTVLIFEVTKEELILISSDPFYKIILPYFNCSSEVYSKVEFIKPTLFTRRIFMQKNINYILDI